MTVSLEHNSASSTPSWVGKKAAKHKQLISLLERLTDDSDFRARFTQEPKACLAEYKLTAIERKAVLAGQQEVRKLLAQNAFAAAMAVLAVKDRE